MHKLKILGLPIAVCLSFALGICQAQTVLTHHVRQATQDGTARFLGNLPSSQTLRLVIALPLRNQDELDQLINDLYDPSSPSYRKFLTVEQFTEKFGPTQRDYDSVINYLQANGLTVVGTLPNRVNVQVTGTVANIQRAFHVNLGVYQHPTENRTFYAPDKEPTTDLSFALWHIEGLNNFSIPRPAGLTHIPQGSNSKSNATTGSGPSASFLGSDMRAAYYSAAGGTLTGAGQTLGLLEYLGTDLADLETYYKNAKQTYPGSIITLVSTDGTSTSCVDSSAGGKCDDGEQTLDMTQALGVAPGLAHMVMFVGSTDAAIFGAMATYSPLPAQLSCSWGWDPADPSTDDPYFKEFAVQGQNLFVAAGDSGKWPSSEGNSGTYPADDVYITSVGGTDLTTSSAGGPWASESAWSDGGGGIAPSKYAIPSWQVTAAGRCASCSLSYRNGPDVSANANFTYYVCEDQSGCTANEYGGTSFAAPLWAGYLALVNEQRANDGSGPLGFINPALYQIGDAGGSTYSAAFHDVTSGSNGFSATTGYDLATGWGSPNGVGLLNALAGNTAPVPDFTIAASPASQTVTAGSGTNYTVTTTAENGFAGNVALSVSGLPSGATGAFNPASISGSGTSTLTITTTSSAAAGTYTLTITGSSGSLNHTASVKLIVSGTTTAASYEAEASGNTLSGRAAVAACTSCSGGRKVRFIGDNTSNYVVINNVTAASAGSYTLTVYGVVSGTRSFSVSVNGAAPVTVSCTGTSWEAPVSAPPSVTVSLKAGSTNTIKFYNNSAYAPDLDRITIH